MSSEENNPGYDSNMSTGYDCVLCDEPNQADKKMARCDKCRKWHHFKCAGLSLKQNMEKIRWICAACNAAEKADPAKVDDAVAAGLNVDPAKSDKTSAASSNIILPPGDDDPQKKGKHPGNTQDDAEIAHQNELKRMREAQELAFRRQLEREMEKQKLQLQLEQEKQEMQLQLELELLKMRRAAEAEFQRKRRQIYSEFGVLTQDQEGNVGGQNPNQNGQNAENGQGKQNYPLSSTPNAAGHLGSVPQQSYVSGTGTPLRNPGDSSSIVQNPPGHPNLPPQNPLQEPTLPPIQNPLLPLIPGLPRPALQQPTLPYPTPQSQYQSPGSVAEGELTRAQISARKGPFAKLPTFTGRPEEWPIFYSSYVNGNAACCWSNLENLGRLQEAIKGKALEVVRSRLLLPELVPTVIEELRDQFGKPEHLLHTLLQKAKKVDPPRFGNASSFNGYGTVVKQLRDHLVAVGLVHHLTNPFLIAELANKLPHQTQTEWVRYNRGKESSLVTFADFVSAVVAEVNEAALIASLAESTVTPKAASPKPKKKSEAVEHGFLNVHTGVEQSWAPLKEQQRNIDRSPRKPCRACDQQDHHIRYCDNFRKLKFNERMEIADKWNLCRMCLNAHGNARCRFKGECGNGDCKERHNNLLHPPTITENPPLTLTALSASCDVHNSEASHPVIFRIVPIRISNGNRTLDVTAFLDEGSSFSLMDDSVAEELKLVGVSKPILVQWTAGMSRLEKGSRMVDVSISAKGEMEKFLLRDVHTVHELQLPEQKVRYAEVAARFKHLSGLPIVDDQGGSPKILIGLKHLHVYAPLESRIGQPGEPIAVRTKLGWTIYGPQGPNEVTTGFSGIHAVTSFVGQDSHRPLVTSHRLEKPGVLDAAPCAVDDDHPAQRGSYPKITVDDHIDTELLREDVCSQHAISTLTSIGQLERLKKLPQPWTDRSAMVQCEVRNVGHFRTCTDRTSKWVNISTDNSRNLNFNGPPWHYDDEMKCGLQPEPVKIADVTRWARTAAHHGFSDDAKVLQRKQAQLKWNGRTNRRTWLRGRVTEVIRGRDNRIRQAKAELPGDIILWRPVTQHAMKELGGKTGQNLGPRPELREGVLAELGTLAPCSTFLSPTGANLDCCGSQTAITSRSDRLSRSSGKISDIKKIFLMLFS